MINLYFSGNYVKQASTSTGKILKNSPGNCQKRGCSFCKSEYQLYKNTPFENNLPVPPFEAHSVSEKHVPYIVESLLAVHWLKIIDYWNKKYLEVPALQVNPRCAYAQNCLGTTMMKH